MGRPGMGPEQGQGNVMSDQERAEAKVRSFGETIEVAGSQVIDQVKELFNGGNVRRLKIHAKDSGFSLELPMTVGVILGGAVALTAPVLAVVGVIAGLVANVVIEVERATQVPDAAPDAEAEPDRDAFG